MLRSALHCHSGAFRRGSGVSGNWPNCHLAVSRPMLRCGLRCSGRCDPDGGLVFTFPHNSWWEHRDSSSYIGTRFFVQDDDEEFPKCQSRRPRARAKARGIPSYGIWSPRGWTPETVQEFWSPRGVQLQRGCVLESNWRPNPMPVSLGEHDKWVCNLLIPQP
jgi:hypothetical protein